jgi:transposase
VTVPEIRAVAPKSVDQQDIQALIRLREKAVRDQTALSNQLRALMAEYGIVMPKGLATLRRRIPVILEDAENGLAVLFRELLAQGYEHLQQLAQHIKAYTAKLQRHVQQQEPIERLQTIPGFGPIVASAFYSEVGDGKAYRRGRDVSASLGLVPKQHSSGGKNRLFGISKRGDSYLRSLLVHGARALLIRAEGKTDRIQWDLRLKREKGSQQGDCRTG